MPLQVSLPIQVPMPLNILRQTKAPTLLLEATSNRLEELFFVQFHSLASLCSSTLWLLVSWVLSSVVSLLSTTMSFLLSSASLPFLLSLPCLLLIAILSFLWWHHPRFGQNPGVPIYPVFGSFIPLLRNKSRLYDWTADLLRNSPTLTTRTVLFGIDMFITANPANVEHILKTSFHNYPKGFRFHMIMESLMGRGILNVDGELWKAQRKVAIHEFSSHSLRSLILESIRGLISARLLPVLRAARDAGAVVDLQDVFLRFAFDNICQISLGVDPGCLNPSFHNVPFAQALDDATELSGQRLITPSWIWKLKAALNIGSEKRMRAALQVVHEFATDAIRKRRNERVLTAIRNQTHERMDLLFRFMCLAEEDKAQCMDRQSSTGPSKEQDSQIQQARSDELLRDMVINFLLAGRDTSSIGLSWFFWVLSRNPRVETAIFEEIQRVLRARAASEQGFRTSAPVRPEKAAAQEVVAVFSFEELKQMQYLHAAVHESLRLYPPLPHDTKLAKEGDVLPDGTQVGKNAQVSYHPYAMGRMARLWGEDCCEYKPERWLDARGEFVQASPYKFPIFQAGPRVCLGKEMAILQMKALAASLIHEFRMPVAQGYVPCYSLSLTMKIKDGLPVHVLPR